ncbi:uncharacterized protein LOC129958597 isoform X3 [Argiope bruennichi]|uniref:uncharacterized protein LOC129958597 isoform X3 n=1 Tax=Argiope bruennichi TaxID=94029 RepID=UPI0024942C0B|nr:uncharacterized protein LOC129958597 isoform X3 [Argiope bruennichi]
MGPPNRPNDIEIVHSLHDLRLKYAKMEINILQNCPYKDVKKDYKPFCHFLERLGGACKLDYFCYEAFMTLLLLLPELQGICINYLYLN